jgi:hypothetical protein
MKLNLRLYLYEDVQKALAADAAIAGAFHVDASAFWVDGESEDFDRILKLTKATSGLRLTPDCVFSAKEQAQARYFQVLSRKTVSESDDDYTLNIGELRAQAPVKTAAGMTIKCMERVYLTKASVAANAVAVLGQWSAEYLVGSTVSEQLKGAGMKGLELRPVYHTKTKAPHAGVSQLYTASLMPPVARNASVMEQETTSPEDCPVSVLGALAYAFDGEPGLADFNRTAEPLNSNHLPLWVVSRKVVELFQEHKLKGWAFRPVLEVGTALYEDYVARWEVLRKKVASNPRHNFAV